MLVWVTQRETKKTQLGLSSFFLLCEISLYFLSREKNGRENKNQGFIEVGFQTGVSSIQCETVK